MTPRKSSRRQARPRKGSGRTSHKKTVAREDVAEMREASAATNELPISDDRIAHYIASIEGFDGKINHLVGKRRECLAAAKAEGILPATIAGAIRDKKLDPLDVRTREKQRAAAFRVIGMDFQTKLFDTVYKDSVEQSTAEGKRDGKRGSTLNNQWPENSTESEAYLQAYHKAQADNVPGAQNLTESEIEEATDA